MDRYFGNQTPKQPLVMVSSSSKAKAMAGEAVLSSPIDVIAVDQQLSSVFRNTDGDNNNIGHSSSANGEETITSAAVGSSSIHSIRRARCLRYVTPSLNGELSTSEDTEASSDNEYQYRFPMRSNARSGALSIFRPVTTTSGMKRQYDASDVDATDDDDEEKQDDGSYYSSASKKRRCSGPLLFRANPIGSEEASQSPLLSYSSSFDDAANCESPSKRICHSSDDNYEYRGYLSSSSSPYSSLFVEAAPPMQGSRQLLQRVSSSDVGNVQHLVHPLSFGGGDASSSLHMVVSKDDIFKKEEEEEEE